MAYDSTLVLTILSQLQGVYDSAFCLSGKPSGEPGVGDCCTRLVRKADQLQRELLATEYPVPDDWLITPCDFAYGPPDKNRHCSAWVAVDARLPAIREQLKRAIMRVQSAVENPPAPKTSGQVDSKTDKRKNLLPRNPDVAKLALKIKRDLPKGGSKEDIALEYADNDAKKAASLLRQLRPDRYGHLLD